MRVVRTLRTSLRALLAHRTRSALAAAGVAVGVAAVFLTAALGAGARDAVLREMSAAGMRLLVIRPGLVKRSASRPELQGAATSLTLEDCEAIRELPAVSAAVPVAEGRRALRSEAGALAASVLGTTPEFLEVRNFELACGRSFDAEEDAASARVAVLGARIASQLFGDGDPVGRSFRVDGVPFEVIGTLRSKGLSFDGSDQDSDVLVPLRTALRRVFNRHFLSLAFVELSAGSSAASVQLELRDLIRARHQPARGGADDFEVQDPVKLLAVREEAARTLSIVSSGFAAISLVVGGTGILALMLLSVRERTSEIGLRIALGARARDILLQFLGEATAVALAGGVVGILLGALGVRILGAATRWEARISPAAALVSLGSAAAIGVAFGVLPALRAARLTPVQALRRG